MTTQPEPTPPGLYQHYKGGRYEVLGTAHHVESGEPLVVYRSTSGQAWARPASEFGGTVGGQPRFTRIGPPAAAARPDPACVIPGTCTHCGQPARAVTTWSHVPIRDDCQQAGATFRPAAATQATGHVYLSTGCFHGDHGYCSNVDGIAGLKKPAQCKFCAAPCVCPCHDARPTVRECAEADRRWPLEKHGE